MLAILSRKCTRCGICAGACPFGAITFGADGPAVGDGCRMCGACMRACPEKAIVRLEPKAPPVDKDAWRDVLVFAEISGGRLHPVVPELLGKARELASRVGYRILAVAAGDGIRAQAEELLRQEKADLIGVGRAIYKDARWGEKA